MAKGKTNNIPVHLSGLYDKLAATIPGIERKGAAMPYTSFNGHMFSFLTPEGTLALRLPEKDRSNFIDKYKTALIVQHGIIMKEYVAVPESLMEKTKELSKYLALSLAYRKTRKYNYFRYFSVIYNIPIKEHAYENTIFFKAIHACHRDHVFRLIIRIYQLS
jgi:hypothetical protein